MRSAVQIASEGHDIEIREEAAVEPVFHYLLLRITEYRG